MLHMFFSDLIFVAFSGIHSSLEQKVAFADRTEKEVDETLHAEFHWHAASGRRLKDTREYFSKPRSREALFELDLFMTAIVFISHSLMATRDPTQIPLVMDFINPVYSPAYLILQYFSGLLRLTHRRIAVYAVVCGFENVAAAMVNKDWLTHIRLSFVCDV